MISALDAGRRAPGAESFQWDGGAATAALSGHASDDPMLPSAAQAAICFIIPVERNIC